MPPAIEPRPRPARFPDCDILRVPAGPGAMYVERYGHGGPAVVLLHGFGTSAFLWRRVAPELAVAGMTAYAIDLLGHGASDRPAGAGFDVRSQSTCIAHVLRDLEVASATVVGCDLGAAVALGLALESPTAVSRLVLVSPSPLRGTPGPDIRLMQRESARHLARLVRGLFGAHPLIGVLLRNAMSDRGALDDRLVGRYVAPYVGRDGLNHFLTLAKSVEEDDLSWIEPAVVPQPALVLHGDADRWCSSADAAELAAALQRASGECVEGSGRLIPEEQPEFLARRIVAHARAPEPERSVSAS